MSITTSLNIRWMIRRDLDTVMDIEKEVGGHWSLADFLACLRDRHTIGMVAEVNEVVVGFMVYRLHKRSIEVLTFTSLGVRTAHEMAAKLKSKLSPDRRACITFKVSDKALPLHCFLRGEGFRADQVLRGEGYDGRDVYRFRYVCQE